MPISEFPEMITDRTQFDVDNGTDKGYYNSEDVNRVNAAVDFIAERLREYGYTVNVTTAAEWEYEEYPLRQDMEQYRQNIATLRTLIATLPTTPPTPESIRMLDYIKANNIEQILIDIDALITNMINAWYECDEVYCGEV